MEWYTNVSVEGQLGRSAVTVGRLYTKEVPVENVRSSARWLRGYFTGDVVLDPEVLTLRAQRDDLLNVSCAKLTVDINGATRISGADGGRTAVRLRQQSGGEQQHIRTSASLKYRPKVPVLTTREVALAIEFEACPVRR